MIDLYNTIVENGNFATASVYGFKSDLSKGLGVTLIDSDFDETKPYEVPNRTILITQLPYGNMEPKDTVLSNVDYVKLDAAVNNALMSMEKKEKEHVFSHSQRQNYCRKIRYGFQ
jgi:hypothetical protein